MQEEQSQKEILFENINNISIPTRYKIIQYEMNLENFNNDTKLFGKNIEKLDKLCKATNNNKNCIHFQEFLQRNAGDFMKNSVWIKSIELNKKIDNAQFLSIL